MSILSKVKDLNNFSDKKNFINLVCKGTKVGFVHNKIASIILSSKLSYLKKNNMLIFKDERKSKLNNTLKNTCNLLFEKKIINEPAGENFPCTTTLGKKEYFVLDRSLVEYLGIRGYGVHLIAYLIGKNKSIRVWVPKRSKKKKIDPNKLDNTVAGGVSAGETIFQALLREGYEEAALKKNVLINAKQFGTINYLWRNKKYTLRRDTLFVFDLKLKKNIIPKNKDGEVRNFKLYDCDQIRKKIVSTNEFKKNCALVLAKFLIYKGLINSKNEKNYEEICRNL